MSGQSGTAVVADVATGRLVASYRLDVAAGRVAAPGSTLKPFTLLAWLEAGKTEGGGRWSCPRQLRLAGRRLDCTHPVLATPMEPASALAYSCNCYFAHLALAFKPAELAQALRRAGLASEHGSVATASSQEELQLQAIGEYGIEVTPLGLLAAYRRLASLRAQRALAPVFEGLEGAVSYGSAQLAGGPGWQVAGKTGTSPHAWFAGFAPAAAPEIVVVVFLERGRGGSDAAPLAGAIFQAYARTRATR